MTTGKATFTAQVIAAALARGETVMVASAAGSSLHRRHPSGLIVITPVKKKPKPLQVWVDDIL
jgi:hypothetical protein